MAATVAHLKGLYAELISPIRDLLDAKHLVLVPHGLLHNVPFHALHDGDSYLMDRFLISYAPSASVFALCQTKPPTSSTGSLILGVPMRTADDAGLRLNESSWRSIFIPAGAE